jgi:hypothetical protein
MLGFGSVGCEAVRSAVAGAIDGRDSPAKPAGIALHLLQAHSSGGLRPDPPKRVPAT